MAYGNARGWINNILYGWPLNCAINRCDLLSHGGCLGVHIVCQCIMPVKPSHCTYTLCQSIFHEYDVSLPLIKSQQQCTSKLETIFNRAGARTFHLINCTNFAGWCIYYLLREAWFSRSINSRRFLNYIFLGLFCWATPFAPKLYSTIDNICCLVCKLFSLSRLVVRNTKTVWNFLPSLFKTFANIQAVCLCGVFTWNYIWPHFKSSVPPLVPFLLSKIPNWLLGESPFLLTRVLKTIYSHECLFIITFEFRREKVATSSFCASFKREFWLVLLIPQIGSKVVKCLASKNTYGGFSRSCTRDWHSTLCKLWNRANVHYPS